MDRINRKLFKDSAKTKDRSLLRHCCGDITVALGGERDANEIREQLEAME